MSNQSIYGKIKSAVGEDGKLPRDFTLAEDKRKPNQISFAPGAMDGIGVYHMVRGNEKGVVKSLGALFIKYFKSDSLGKEKYISEIETLLSESRTLSVVDGVLDYIKSKRGSVKAESIVEAAVELSQTSDKIEVVKTAIALFGLFELGKIEEIVDIVLTLALYDDFALYSVVAVLNWSDCNALVFKIAQNVDGWGKIHAVERLEPENEEIRQWILRKGCANGVVDAYLGLVTAEKGDLISALKQDSLDSELFDGISIIVNAMLDEGPTTGISGYSQAGDALRLYLNHAEKQAVSIRHLSYVLALQSWAESLNEENDGDYFEDCTKLKSDVMTSCAKIADNSKWRDKIVAAINNREYDRESLVNFNMAADAARQLNIDVNAELFDAVKANPLEYSWQMSRLMEVPELAEEIVELCESVLPLDKMSSGMGDYMFPDDYREEHNCLDIVLQQLSNMPLKGVKLVKCGLNSPVIRNRNMAIKAMTGWTKSLGKPLSEISAELYDEVMRIREIEVNDSAKENIEKLLTGIQK